MKRLSMLFAATCLLLVLAACSGARSYPNYSESSDFTLDSLEACDPQVVENLEVLCRVWGYAKYHHPVFAGSKVDVDYELFGLLPRVAHAGKEERNRVLCAWVKGLGRFRTNRQKYDEALRSPDLRELAGLEWVRDTMRLGGELSEVLQELRYAEREKNRYGAYLATINILDMKAERTGDAFDDCGYRLLYLFRYWNAIEYFCPNRNSTGHDWGTIPAHFIPLFAAGTPECRLLLNRELCDSHAAGYAVRKFGYRTLPVEVNYADNRIFVVRGESLYPGDEIISVDGRGWTATYNYLERFESVSNEEKLNWLTASCMCRSTSDTVTVEVRRNGLRQRLRVPTIGMGEAYEREQMRMDAPENVRLIDDGVGYMTGRNYTGPEADRIMGKFRDTKALIVDMRCYPREFMVFSFVGRRFIPERVQHVKWLSPEPGLPGAFRFSPDYLEPFPGSPWRPNPDFYKGRVVVLVDASTQSQAEYTVMAFQAAPRCTVVGTQTAGADGNVVRLVMPGNEDPYFSGLGVYYPDGTDTQRAGVRIDVEVHPTVAGLCAGRDEVLEKALEIVRTNEFE